MLQYGLYLNRSQSGKQPRSLHAFCIERLASIACFSGRTEEAPAMQERISAEKNLKELLEGLHLKALIVGHYFLK